MAKIDKASIWGSPEYLCNRYGDIEKARKIGRNDDFFKKTRELVRKYSTTHDRLDLWELMRTTGEGPEGRRDSVVAHISFGLNGDGKQADYLAALSRLVKTGLFKIFDAYIDACDDVASVLCVCNIKFANCDHRKQRGRTAPNRKRARICHAKK